MGGQRWAGSNGRAAMGGQRWAGSDGRARRPRRTGRIACRAVPPCPPVMCPPVLCPPVLCPPVLCPPVLCPPVLCPPVLCPPVLCPPVPVDATADGRHKSSRTFAPKFFFSLLVK